MTDMEEDIQCQECTINEKESVLKAHNLVIEVRDKTHIGWKRYEDLDEISDTLKDIYYEIEEDSGDE